MTEHFHADPPDPRTDAIQDTPKESLLPDLQANVSSLPPQMETRALIEAVIASTVGTTIEWYDFFLYGTAAALVFPALFFPEQSEFVGQILSFLTFTAGFVARPLGGIIFGYLGDRVGRKSTLVSTLFLMGISTVIIGLLPTHQTLGGLAAVLLTLMRVFQGIGVGGEWGGAVLMALESGHRGRRGFWASWPQVGVPLGLLTSTGVFALVRWLLPDDFNTWGWRIPFLLSGVLIGVGLLIRLRILESPLFRQLQATNQLSRAPLKETIVRYWKHILLVAGSRLTENACFYLFTAYVLSYGTKVLKKEEWIFLTAVNVAAAVEVVTMPLFGILSDWWSRKAVYSCGCLFLAVIALPYYMLLSTGEPVWIILATVVALNGGHAVLYSVQASLIPELFGTRVRYTGASIGYQLAAPIAGGLSPVIAASLVKATGGQAWPLAQYIIVLSVISLVCVQLLAETSRKDLTADH